MTTETVHAAPKDNLFGICAAVGEDFGFNPLWLRLAFAGSLLFSLQGVIAAYFALGALVLVSRLAFPNPKGAKPAVVEAAPTPAPAIAAYEPEYRQAA